VPKKRLSKSSLLWFIRSRSYVSIPDIRRRFNLTAGDDVTVMVVPDGRVYVGLPSEAARVLADLVREGRVGLELAPGILAKAVTGVYIIPGRHERAVPSSNAPAAEDEHEQAPPDESAAAS